MQRDHATLSLAIGRFVANLDQAALTDELTRALKSAVLDCVGVILSGSRETASRAVTDKLHRASTASEATIIGRCGKSTVETAALANGVMAHACDYDEMCWSIFGHVTAPVLPAVLAVSEWRGISGIEFLAALCAGLEVSMQIGLHVGLENYERGWHSTSTLGVLGAAAASGKALRLDAQRVAYALGIAASRAAGLRENVGSMTKPLHVGFAARDGCEAALLAESNVTASLHALDGTYGFINTLASHREDQGAIASSLGNPFDILASGLSYKLYPCCADTHAAVDAALELREEFGLKPSGIRRVRCGITPLAFSNLTFHAPRTPIEAKFSAEFCVAVALICGSVGLKHFTQEHLDLNSIRDLMTKIDVRIEPGYAEHNTVRYSPAKLSIEMADGHLAEREVPIARGNPSRPLTAAEMERKFLDCAAGTLEPAAAQRSLETILTLERQPNLDALMAALSDVIDREDDRRERTGTPNLTGRTAGKQNG